MAMEYSMYMWVAIGIIAMLLLNTITYFAYRIKWVPEVIWVLVLGVIYSALAAFTDFGLPMLPLRPDPIIYLFVPLLIFASAQQFNIFEFKKVLPAAVTLGSVGIMISVMLMSLILHYVAGFAWLPAILFAAILSATDPLAIGAILEENTQIPTSRKLLVEGESIINDGIVITLFCSLYLILFNEGIFTVINGAKDVAMYIAGAIVTGFIVAKVARWLLRVANVCHFILQCNMSLLVAYGSFILSEGLHFSGVLATFTAAIVYAKRRHADDKAMLLNLHLWRYFEYLANAILFFWLGASFFVYIDNTQLSLALFALAIICLTLPRMVSLAVLLPLMRIHSKPFSMFDYWLLNLSGSRGAICIALILLLPEDFALKHTFLCLAFTMVMLSLLLYPLLTDRLVKAHYGKPAPPPSACER